jgi:hypothetical protein
VLSLASLGGAFVALVATNQGLAVLLGLVGVAALAGAIATASRAQRATRYRPRPFTRADWWMVGTAAAAVGTLAFVSITGPSLRWSASSLQFPSFSLGAAAAIAVLALPAFAVRSQK